MNGKKCETSVYSRITGFYQPLKQWNPGKKEEFKDREKYAVKKQEEEADVR